MKTIIYKTFAEEPVNFLQAECLFYANICLIAAIAILTVAITLSIFSIFKYEK